MPYELPYDKVRRARGLSGTQGVMIPESNVAILMLKEEIVCDS